VAQRTSVRCVQGDIGTLLARSGPLTSAAPCPSVTRGGYSGGFGPSPGSKVSGSRTSAERVPVPSRTMRERTAQG